MDKYTKAMEKALNEGIGRVEFNEIVNLIKNGQGNAAELATLDLAHKLAQGELKTISYRGEDRIEKIARRDAHIGLTWAIIYAIRNEIPAADAALHNALQDLAIIDAEKKRIAQERSNEEKARKERERLHLIRKVARDRALKEQRVLEEKRIAEEEAKIKILIIWHIGCTTRLYIVRTTDKELINNILRANGKFGGDGCNKEEAVWLADYVLELQPADSYSLDPKNFDYIVFSGYTWDGVHRY